jgi:5-aminolevulinate synthase
VRWRADLDQSGRGRGTLLCAEDWTELGTDLHPFYAHCRETLGAIHAQGRYRRFSPLAKQAGRYPIYRMEQDGLAREVTVWSSNDYVGMGTEPVVIEAAIEAARKYGAGAGGTRNIA